MGRRGRGSGWGREGEWVREGGGGGRRRDGADGVSTGGPGGAKEGGGGAPGSQEQVGSSIVYLVLYSLLSTVPGKISVGGFLQTSLRMYFNELACT